MWLLYFLRVGVSHVSTWPLNGKIVAMQQRLETADSVVSFYGGILWCLVSCSDSFLLYCVVQREGFSVPSWMLPPVPHNPVDLVPSFPLFVLLPPRCRVICLHFSLDCWLFFISSFCKSDFFLLLFFLVFHLTFHGRP